MKYIGRVFYTANSNKYWVVTKVEDNCEYLHLANTMNRDNTRIVNYIDFISEYKEKL
jgi:hypothetical protein